MIIQHHHYHTPKITTSQQHQLITRGRRTSKSSRTTFFCHQKLNSSSAINSAISTTPKSRRLVVSIAVSLVAACAVLLSPAAEAKGKKEVGEEEETLGNVPQTLAGECEAEQGKDCNKKKMRIQRPKSRKAEVCTVKCVNTCIRGDEGEGPFNIRRPLVVFKQGFRSRQYCLVECSDICNLIGDGDDGP
ncbi:hypothetical protein LINPERPRIM_LOCUS24055 [Linum perenne]